MTATALSLAGVANFRDFGGRRTQDGGTVVAGKLYRSAHFAAATDEDLVRLEALAAAVLVDLRLPGERALQPNRWAPARSLLREAVAGPAISPPTAADPPPGAYSADVGRAVMRSMYARIPYDPGFIAVFATLLRTLAEHDGPMIVHCSVGKDRTGVVCALILHALGVGRPDVFDDYLASNAALNRAERARLIRAELEPLHGPLDDATIAPVIGVDAAYLQASLDEIEQRSGSLASYFAQDLGVAPAALERLREKLIVA